MKVTPRRDEVKAVVEVLESPDYDSAEAMAKDVIKLVATLFAERDWYAFAHRDKPGSLVLAWGPLSSDAEVKRFGKKMALGGEALSVKLYSTARSLRYADEMDTPPNTECGGCRHPIGLHEHPKTGGACVARGCTCTRVVKAAA